MMIQGTPSPTADVHTAQPTRKHAKRWLFLLCLAMFAWPQFSFAAENDVYLHFLYEGKTAALQAKQQQSFSFLSAEYGFAITDPVVSPAETLGIAGFDLGVELSIVDIPELQDRWRRAVEDERPDNYLNITRIRLRKGLPFSLEVEGSLGLIAGSTAVLGSAGLKWALNDGFYYFPDIAIRGSVNRLFGSRDMQLFSVAADAWISKQFAIAGMFTITPYAGYSFVYVRADSAVLDPTPTRFIDNESNTTRNFVFESENHLGNRAFFGVRLVWFIMSITLEGSFIIPNFEVNGERPETISSFNGKLSFFF